MFVDICFPNENEPDFIETGKKINIKSLCFIYEKLPKVSISYSMRTFSGILLGKPSKGDIILTNRFDTISKNKKVHYYYEGISRINQVLIKKLVMQEKLVGVSFNYLLRCLKKPEKLEDLRLFIKLCRKYHARIFVASFARTPYELRSKLQIMSILHFLGMDTKTQKEAVEQLHRFLLLT